MEIKNLPIELFHGVCDNLSFEDVKNLSIVSKDFNKKINEYKKRFIIANHLLKENNIFSFDYKYLIKNSDLIKSQIVNKRNTIFLNEYAFDKAYMTYLTHIDLLKWSNLEYILEWFENKGTYKLPIVGEDFDLKKYFNFKENNYFMFGTDIIKYDLYDINLPLLLKDHINKNKNYKDNLYINPNFQELGILDP